MTDQEFDKYLSLLGGVLRLNTRQRDAIRSELKAHLEERLDELVEAGREREKAVSLALSELGDAATLAKQFSRVETYRKRRWMMRFTTLTIAGSFVAVVMLASMWPDQSRLTVTNQAGAQDDPYGAGGGGGRVARTQSVDEERVVEQKLDGFIRVEYFEDTMGDVLDVLQEELDVDFFVKSNTLAQQEVSVDEPVTMSFRRIRASMFLDLMLEPHGLTYLIRDGIVIITSTNDAEVFHEVKVYNCRDLIAKLNHRGQLPGMGGPSGGMNHDPYGNLGDPYGGSSGGLGGGPGEDPFGSGDGSFGGGDPFGGGGEGGTYGDGDSGAGDPYGGSGAGGSSRADPFGGDGNGAGDSGSYPARNGYGGGLGAGGDDGGFGSADAGGPAAGGSGLGGGDGQGGIGPGAGGPGAGGPGAGGPGAGGPGAGGAGGPGLGLPGAGGPGVDTPGSGGSGAGDLGGGLGGVGSGGGIGGYAGGDASGQDPGIGPGSGYPSGGSGGYPGAGGGFPGEGAASGGGYGVTDDGYGTKMGGYAGGGGSGMDSYGNQPYTDDETRQLIMVIMETIDFQSWSSAGGAGKITGYNGLVIVRQNPKVHRQIQDLLQMLDLAVSR